MSTLDKVCDRHGTDTYIHTSTTMTYLQLHMKRKVENVQENSKSSMTPNFWFYLLQKWLEA
jgi:hypothetical protein